MKLYLYKNNFCDPARKIGIAKMFDGASDVDAYLKFFVQSCKSEALKEYRAFLTNDDVEFYEVDHFVLMDESFGVMSTIRRVKEFDLLEIARSCKHLVAESEKLVRKRKRDKDMAIKRGEVGAEERLGLYKE